MLYWLGRLQIRTNQVKCWFWRGGNRSNQGKTSRSRGEPTNSINPHMASNPGNDPKPHWWKASALTTAPTLPAPASWPLSYLGLLMILYSVKLPKKNIAANKKPTVHFDQNQKASQPSLHNRNQTTCNSLVIRGPYELESVCEG